MRILVANDDGIYSPGIAALVTVAKNFGDVRVVAPDVEQSSAGHAITASRPVRYRPTQIFDDVETYRVNGTPADCVRLGLTTGVTSTSFSLESTSGQTSATQRGTPARSRLRSRPSCSGFAASR